RVRAEGRGAILFTGHYGNFDLFAATIAARGYPLSVVVQKQRNSLVEARLTLTRERMGERVIARGGGAREILRALERNEFIAILGDQDAHEGGVFVDFFGRPASTPRGPARLARLAGAPLVFAVLERVEDGTHVARIEDPIYPEAGSDEEAEVVRLTTAVTRLLEGAVRRRPDHYLWVHRRWKTRPPGEETGR
ncbi:MAG: lipid A biosynthesis acyltransferase, partial [Candidatus Latescibacterota bacterium]